MPRTEKRFGVVNQPTASTPTELVPTATTTRNVLINATARTSAIISAAIYSGAYSNDATGTIVVSSISNASSTNPVANSNYSMYSGRGNVFLIEGSNYPTLCAVDAATNRILYAGNTNASSGSNWWRNGLFSNNVSPQGIAFKAWAANSYGVAKLTNPYALVSDTRAIAITADYQTSATANSDMFDAITITHTVGTSITESNNDVGQTRFQGATSDASGAHAGGAYPLQDGVGYLLHAGGAVATAATSGIVALGIYIYSSSSTAFQKRAFWNTDGTTNKTIGFAISYFIASDYNSTHQVFAFSQPSTTTLWSGISATSSTSWPAGYALPSAAAPAGFRIVSNSGTTEPDVNFLTGTITYPDAPTGVTVPSTAIPVSSIKFSPDNSKVAIAYRRNYSGSGNTNSVVVVYTRQNDGTWTHTNSSGSAIPFQPDTPEAMTWSGDGGTIAIHGTSTSDSSINSSASPTFNVYLWNVGGGTSGFVANSSVQTWSIASSKYPEFSEYIKPTTGSSSISSSVSSYIISNFASTSTDKSVASITWMRSDNSAGSYITAFSNVNVVADVVKFGNIQVSGTVGVSGQPASNYVTTVISDLSLTSGQTSQVSNIVLGSGERIFVEASASNAVDISAHGIEST